MTLTPYKPSTFVFFYILGLLHVAPLLGDDWPQFRGPGGQGHHTTSKELPKHWSETESVTWKVPISGLGWSSPVVSGEEIWLTTAIEEERSLRALCIHVDTGDITHDIEVFAPEELVVKHARNSHATPTPVIGHKHVFVHFGTYGTAALDRETGEVAWRNEDLVLEHQWGPGSSPILVEDRLVFNCDGMKRRYVVALDARTGEIAWKTERSIPINKGGHYRKAFSTPLQVESNGELAIVSTGANQVSAYAARSGQELWTAEFNGYASVSTPVTSRNLVLITTGYGDKSLIAIHTESIEGRKAGDIAWKTGRSAPIIPSPIAVDGAIYVTSDDGILQCLDANSGESLWKTRLSGNFASSPTYAGGYLYFHNDRGETFVIEPDQKQLKLEATNQLDSNIQASMAVVDTSIFIRTASSLYRID